jgi:hypothetical protein
MTSNDNLFNTIGEIIKRTLSENELLRVQTFINADKSNRYLIGKFRIIKCY